MEQSSGRAKTGEQSNDSVEANQMIDTNIYKNSTKDVNTNHELGSTSN